MNPSKPNARIDRGITSMLQHQAYMLLNELIQNSIRTIELAVQCDDPRLEQIAKDCHHLYADTQQLIKFFIIAGMNPIPDESWEGYQEMRKVFDLTHEEMFSQLNDETKIKIRFKGIQL
jgi:hypothetical protein